MKNFKLIPLILAICLCLCVTGPSAHALEEPEIPAKAAVVIDLNSGTVMYSLNMDEQRAPASLTKVMTVLLTLEAIDTGRIALTDIVTAQDDCRVGMAEDSSTSGIMPGDQVSVRELLYCCLLQSANEGCNILGRYIGGSIAGFVDMMNAKAEELGLKNTHFTNVSGLHNKSHYTTCTEMAILMAEVIKNDFCREIISTEYYTVAKNQYHDELKYHSGMFEKMYGTEPEVATIKGGKTGFTSQSLYCLVSYAVTDDGRDIICVTAKGEGKYTPIYDCIDLYKQYTHPEK